MKIKPIEYEDMQKAWDDLILDPPGYDPRECCSIFSMFDSIDEVEGDWMVRPFIDFLDPKAICKGETTVTIQDWDEKSQKMINPKWPAIANFFHYNNDGHHIYLEGITVGKDTIVLSAGS